MSITRLKDGFNNCYNKEDEWKNLEIDLSKSCSHIHRFRCSITQVTCLSVMALGNEKTDCANIFDELWFGTYRRLSAMNCNDQRQDECSLSSSLH